MTMQEKSKLAIYYYKELNEELLKRFNNNTLFELKMNKEKTLQYIGCHADAILLADTFIGRRFYNISENSNQYYEFIDYLKNYNFNKCKVQIYLKCDLDIQVLLIAIS